MTVERLDFKEATKLEITACAGNLEIRGSERAEFVIEYDAPRLDHGIEVQDDTVIIDNLPGNGVIRIPIVDALRVGSVAGNLEVRDIPGEIGVGHVGGNCAARRVGSLAISEGIGGNLTLKDIDGPVQIGNAVGGACSARRVESLSITGTYLENNSALHTPL